MNYKLVINLNLVPLKEQVNVIWLSKVILDLDQLARKSCISSSYITYILSHEAEILTRWLKASKRTKADRAINNVAESYKYKVIDRILGEWIHRINEKRRKHWITVQPLEIEQQANIIKQQLGVASYCIGTYIWNKEFKSKVINRNGSLDTADILDDIQHEVLQDTYTEFKEKIREFHLKQIHDDEGHIETRDQIKRFKVSHDKQITETTGCSAAIGLTNVDLTEEDAEECGDQQNEDLSMGNCQYEDLTSILSDSEEVEQPSSFDNSQNEDRDVGFVIDEFEENEDFCNKSTKDEYETMEVSSEQDENSHDELVIDLREEKTQDSRHQSSSNMSINAANLNEKAIIETEGVIVVIEEIEENDENEELGQKSSKDESATMEVSSEQDENAHDDLLIDLRGEKTQDSSHQSSSNMSINAANLNEKAIIETEESKHSPQQGVILVIEEIEENYETEELGQKSSKDESATMEVSSEQDENAHDDLLIDLREETTQDSSYQSASNMSIKAENLNEEAIIEIEESSHVPQQGVIVVIKESEENEVFSQKSSKHESETMQISSEQDENSLDDLLIELRKETTQDRSHQSSSNMSVKAANLNEEAIIEIEESSHSPQQVDNSLVLQTTDSIEELVKKYQMYKNKQQHLSLLASNREYHQHYDNEFFGQNKGADEDDILNDKQKSDNNILHKTMQFSYPMQKKICIESYSKNSIDVSKEHSHDSRNKYKHMKSKNRWNTTAHLNREDELILTLDDESENSSSEEHEYTEDVLEILSDEEDCNQSAIPLTLQEHTILNKKVPTVESYTTATKISDLIIKSNAEAFSYLSILRDFCRMQNASKALEIVTNLQMEFYDPNT